MDRKIIDRLIAKAWGDPEYFRRLVAEPRKCLREAGVVLGSLVVVLVSVAGQAEASTVEQKLGRGLREDETVYEIVIPEKPAELSDMDFAKLKPTQRATTCSC